MHVNMNLVDGQVLTMGLSLAPWLECVTGIWEVKDLNPVRGLRVFFPLSLAHDMFNVISFFLFVCYGFVGNNMYFFYATLDIETPSKVCIMFHFL